MERLLLFLRTGKQEEEQEDSGSQYHLQKHTVSALSCGVTFRNENIDLKLQCMELKKGSILLCIPIPNSGGIVDFMNTS